MEIYLCATVMVSDLVIVYSLVMRPGLFSTVLLYLVMLLARLEVGVMFTISVYVFEPLLSSLCVD